MSSRAALGGVLAAALLLRLLGNHLLTIPAPVLDHDALWYHAAAQSLADGRGYVGYFSGKPTASWPPGYSAILSLPYRLFGPDASSAYALNALAGVVTCWLAGLIATRLSSPRAALLATAAMAVAPSQVLFASLVMSETVFTLMSTALVLAAIVLLKQETPSPGSWLAWGLGAGLASLVRAEAAVLLLVPLFTLALSAAGRRAPLALASVALAALTGSLIAQAPWLLRNAELFGTLVPVSTSFGRTFLIGHNPVADGGMNLWSPDPMADAADLASGDPARELAVDRRLRKAGVDFALANPRAEAGLFVQRLRRMYRGDRVWGEWYEPGPSSPVTPAVVENLGRISNAFWWLLLLAAAPGLVRFARAKDAATRLVPLLILGWTLFFTVLLYGTERFHFPLIPLFCVLGADTLARLLDKRNPPAAEPPRARPAIDTRASMTG